MELKDSPLRVDASLKGYWRFEGGVTDELGANDFDTIVGTPSYPTGKFYQGIHTNSGYATKATNLGITVDPFSMSIWIKLNAEISSGQLRFCSLRTGDVRDLSYQLMYFYNAGTRRISARRTTQGVLDVDSLYNITLGTMNWYHLVMTSDGTNIRLYLNGSLVAGPTSAAGYGTGTTTQGVQVGESYDFDADDFAVFNKTLSAAEVLALYGSAIKTVNGLALASVKTVNGLAIASVKNVNGLS